ncbi:hypothetical protein GCM10022259_28010 [Aquimarina mytili]
MVLPLIGANLPGIVFCDNRVKYPIRNAQQNRNVSFLLLVINMISEFRLAIAYIIAKYFSN